MFCILRAGVFRPAHGIRMHECHSDRLPVSCEEFSSRLFDSNYHAVRNLPDKGVLLFPASSDKLLLADKWGIHKIQIRYGSILGLYPGFRLLCLLFVNLRIYEIQF